TATMQAVIPPALFLAGVAARQLQAMLTQQGILTAASFRITPLPHQVLAVDFILGQFHPRAMLADEVGLGKTIEAAMVFEELKLRRQVRRALFVVPAGLTHQWRDEFEQKFGEKFVLYDRVLFSALREIHGREANLWKLNDQVITSLDFIKPRRIRPGLSAEEKARREEHNRLVFQHLQEAGWDLAVFDEAHKLSKHGDGSETTRYQVGEALARSVPVVLLLTATPHQGDPGHFLHLLNLVDAYDFQNTTDLRPDRVAEVVWRTRKRAAVDANGKQLFKGRITDIYPVDRSGQAHTLERQLYDEVTEYVREHYNQAMQRGDRAFGFLMILFQRLVTSSSAAIAEALARRLERLMSLRTRLTQEAVPDGQEDFDEQAQQDEDAQASLDELIHLAGVVDLAELQEEIGILERLLDLARQARRLHDSKVSALLQIIDEVRRREGPLTKFLIFTEFVATQKALCQILEGLGYSVTTISGSKSLEERIAARKAFAEQAQFLVSTDAGGEGINLQFCHVMVNYDLPWNPMKLEQRIGRLDRIGQTRDVLVLNLLISDTVEARVREVLEEKLGLIRKQFGDDKLADILSTLQEEFLFDRLYMDAVMRNAAQSAELEHLAQQIFDRARQVLEKDDLLLPQSQAQMEQFRQRLVESAQPRLRAMLEGYLAARGEQLHEYSRRVGVYYFDLPQPDGFRIHYPDVVFDRSLALADDSLDYIHLNHPLIQDILAELTDGKQPGLTLLRLKQEALPAGLMSGDSPVILALYWLRYTNYLDMDRQELIPVAVDATGQPLPRLARALLELTPDQVEAVFVPPTGLNISDLLDQARQLAEAQAGDRFSEAQMGQSERVQGERQKIERYYRQQEAAVAQIAIENIRQGKRRELLERRRVDLKSLDERRLLVPDLTMIGMALVTLERGV
ncbi:MAG: helicase-related protein, partial [Chloroflexota bacterium]